MSDPASALAIDEQEGVLVSAHGEQSKLTVSAMSKAPLQPSFFEVDTETVTRAEAQALEKLSVSLKLTKKNVRIIIPDSYSYSQIVSMPILKEKELLAAIKYQADQFIPMPIEETSLDLEILREDKANKQLIVLIVAAGNSLVSKIEKTVEMAGLIPESLENELCAASRFISRYYRSQSTLKTLFVNVGYAATSLYYYDPTIQLVTDTHSFKLGIALFLKEIQVNLRLDAVKAQEALRTIGFASGGSVDLQSVLHPTLTEFIGQLEKFIVSVKERHKDSGIDNIIFFNKVTHVPTLVTKVGSQFGIKATIFEPSVYLTPPTVIAPHQSELSAYISAFGGSL